MMLWLDLIPRWLLLAVAVAMLAVSGVLQYSNIKLSLEVEKGKTYAAQLETSISDSNARANASIALSERQARKAIEDSQVRARSLAADAANARAALNGLRDTIQNSYGLRAPNNAIGAGLEYADTYGADLLTVSSRFVALSEVCDGHVNDLRTVIETWPRWGAE